MYFNGFVLVFTFKGDLLCFSLFSVIITMSVFLLWLQAYVSLCQIYLYGHLLQALIPHISDTVKYTFVHVFIQNNVSSK